MTRVRRSPALPRGFSRHARLYLRPTALIGAAGADAAIEAGVARRLAGGAFAFSALEVFVRDRGAITAVVAPLAEAAAWAGGLDGPAAGRVAALFDRLSAPRAPVSGVAMDRPSIMGVINVTPDSFSDGGDFAEADAAIAHGRALADAGAAILDVGGESTRPGSDAITAEAERARALPVVEALAAEGFTVSIDTRRAGVMRAALEAGARIVNDVSALTFDAESLGVVAAAGAPVVLMHCLGDPKTMQESPAYDFAPLDVYDYLEARVEACEAAGIDRARIVVDPGIGFGKTPTGHNVEILQSLSLYHGLGCPLLFGVSRKSFIGRLAGVDAPKARLPGSLAAGLAGLDRGVQIIRVHDVAETAQALAVWQAIAGPPGDARG